VTIARLFFFGSTGFINSVTLVQQTSRQSMLVEFILISRTQSRLPSGQCVLTFDDGPAGSVTDGLLAILDEFGVKACFCLVGSQVVIRPEQTRAIAEAGHLMVNHTFHHRLTDLWNIEKFRLDLARCDQAICGALGEKCYSLPWFRPPFGLVTAAVREIARTRRILPVTHFALDPWVKSDRTRRPAKRIIADAKRREGGIYVLHDGLMTSKISRLIRGSPRRRWIPGVVQEILGELPAAGFQFPDPSRIFTG
jgi:peptidoglycan/xylan/chitin deacetylase (PgdA/CDA1 family)